MFDVVFGLVFVFGYSRLVDLNLGVSDVFSKGWSTLDRAADYGRGAYLPSAHCMLLKDKIQLSFHVQSGHKGLKQQ